MLSGEEKHGMALNGTKHVERERKNNFQDIVRNNVNFP